MYRKAWLEYVMTRYDIQQNVPFS